VLHDRLAQSRPDSASIGDTRHHPAFLQERVVDLRPLQRTEIPATARIISRASQAFNLAPSHAIGAPSRSRAGPTSCAPAALNDRGPSPHERPFPLFAACIKAHDVCFVAYPDIIVALLAPQMWSLTAAVRHVEKIADFAIQQGMGKARSVAPTHQMPVWVGFLNDSRSEE